VRHSEARFPKKNSQKRTRETIWEGFLQAKCPSHYWVDELRPDIICVLVNFFLESFTAAVYRCLVSNVLCGQTVSYCELAQLSGNARASRAVGQAMRRNPVPLLIPCHRVIHSNGQAGHYSGGRLDFLKQWLLTLEKSRTWEIWSFWNVYPAVKCELWYCFYFLRCCFLSCFAPHGDNYRYNQVRSW